MGFLGIDVERYPFVVSLALTAAILVVLIWRDWRRNGGLPLTFFLQYLFLSAASGFAWGLGVMPAVVFGVRFSRGSSLEASVYPGQSPDWLVGTLVVGAVAAGLIALWTALSWPPRNDG